MSHGVTRIILTHTHKISYIVACLKRTNKECCFPIYPRLVDGIGEGLNERDKMIQVERTYAFLDNRPYVSVGSASVYSTKHT